MTVFETDKSGDRFQWLVRHFGWVLFIGQSIAFAIMLAAKISLTDPQWQIYVNAWFPLAWTRLTALFFILFLIDRMFPGAAISTILNIDSSSSSEDKRTAMWFLLGFGALIVWAMKGQL